VIISDVFTVVQRRPVVVERKRRRGQVRGQPAASERIQMGFAFVRVSHLVQPAGRVLVRRRPSQIRHREVRARQESNQQSTNASVQLQRQQKQSELY